MTKKRTPLTSTWWIPSQRKALKKPSPSMTRSSSTLTKKADSSASKSLTPITSWTKKCSYKHILHNQKLITLGDISNMLRLTFTHHTLIRTLHLILIRIQRAAHISTISLLLNFISTLLTIKTHRTKRSLNETAMLLNHLLQLNKRTH